MYVFHHTCMPAVSPELSAGLLGLRFHSHNAGVFAFALLSAAATYFMAYASWHLYERHFLRLRRFFPY